MLGLKLNHVNKKGPLEDKDKRTSHSQYHGCWCPLSAAERSPPGWVHAQLRLYFGTQIPGETDFITPILHNIVYQFQPGI